MTETIQTAMDRLMTISAEPQDYIAGDGLLYCGSCKTPKEAFFPNGKKLFGRDRHPAECRCRQATREKQEKEERANQLVVMCREDDLTIPSGLLAPLHDFQNDGRCQLVVEIVQVTDIRLEVVQNFPQLHSCFLAVDSFDRVGQLAQFAATVEVHTRCISIDPVAHAAAFMLHTEVLNLMSVLL